MFKDRRIKAATISIFVDLVLVTLKLWGASISQSRGLHADALHSFSDIGVSALVLLGILGASRFQKWGKGIGDGTAFFIGLIILWVGIGVLRSPTIPVGDVPLQNIPMAILLTWICILISYFVSGYKLRVGQECDVASLRADGHHSRMDMYSSIAVLLGLVGNWIGLSLDAIASIIVGLMILRLALVVLAAATQDILRSDGHIADSVSQLEVKENWIPLLISLGEHAGVNTEGVMQYTKRLLAFSKQRKRILYFCGVFILVVWYGASGLYVIGADELGVLTRFGRLKESAVPPGLHYRIPSPFSTLYRATPDRIFQLEFGFRTVGKRGVSTEPQAYLWENQHLSGLYEKKVEEAILLTGDKNEVDLNFTIEYRLMPEVLPRFYFNVAEPEALIRVLAQQCIQKIAATRVLTDVLTTDRMDIEKKMLINLQPLLDDLDLGVKLSAVRLQDVHPPAQVVRAFRSVAAAREERSTIIHKAESYRNETLPAARGGASVLKNDASAYITEKRLKAAGDASRFSALAEVHLATPEAVHFLWYVTALEKSLQDSRILLFDEDIMVGSGGDRLTDYFLGTEFFKRGAIRTFGSEQSKNKAEELADEIESELR
ncbi:MAG: protease modulator HflK family protein [Candidatus Hydrogenedentes bacterium]|nr:protease modulator HflK family protein [Candidatus Hydrogenedentota bacterium]